MEFVVLLEPFSEDNKPLKIGDSAIQGSIKTRNKEEKISCIIISLYCTRDKLNLLLI